MNEQLINILKVTTEELDGIDMSFIETWLNKDDTGYMHHSSGREHYRLLTYISTLYDDKIIFDVGTNECRSAVCLANNNHNRVKSYDIIQVLPENPTLNNIEFILGDSTKDLDILSSPFIFIDVDHDGIYEEKFLKFLKEHNWKGLLLMDDIHLNADMKRVWESINTEKYDLTNKGHWSGTGLAVFR